MDEKQPAPPPAVPDPFFSIVSGHPGEPKFVLGASDASFTLFLSTWADDRQAAIASGKAPLSDVNAVVAAKVLVDRAEKWREEHMGAQARTAYVIPAENGNAQLVVHDENKKEPGVNDPGPAPVLPDAKLSFPNVDGTKRKPRPTKKKLEQAVVDGAAKKDQVKQDTGPGRVKLSK